MTLCGHRCAEFIMYKSISGGSMSVNIHELSVGIKSSKRLFRFDTPFRRSFNQHYILLTPIATACLRNLLIYLLFTIEWINYVWRFLRSKEGMSRNLLLLWQIYSNFIQIHINIQIYINQGQKNWIFLKFPIFRLEEQWKNLKSFLRYRLQVWLNLYQRGLLRRITFYIIFDVSEILLYLLI